MTIDNGEAWENIGRIRMSLTVSASSARCAQRVNDEPERRILEEGNALVVSPRVIILTLA